MNRFTGKLCAFVGLLAIVAGLGGCTGEQSDTIAVVNGERIPRQDWERRCETAGQDYLNQNLPEIQRGLSPLPVGYTMLNKMIGSQIVLQMGKKAKLLATAQEVQQELSRRMARDKTMLDSEAMFGHTKKMVMDDLRVDQTLFKLTTAGVIVTDAEVDDYIKLHPEMFTTPATVTVRIISVSSPVKKAQVDKDLATGTTFEVAAQTRSEDGLKGNPTTQAVTRLPEPVVTALNKVKAMGITDWVPVGGSGYVKFQLVDRAEQKLRAPSAEDKVDLKRNLMVSKARDQVNFNDKLLDEINRAKVDIKEGWLATIWKQEAKNRKEQMSVKTKAESGARSGVTAPSK